MSEVGRVVTAKLPAELVSCMDQIAERMERSKSWIIRQAVSEWIAEEQRRHQLTLEAIDSIEAGEGLTQEEVERHFAERREARRRTACAA